jgi:hypothetical protein
MNERTKKMQKTKLCVLERKNSQLHSVLVNESLKVPSLETNKYFPKNFMNQKLSHQING